eukprot:jgi/Mesvir1/22636/Mv14071-RA.1
MTKGSVSKSPVLMSLYGRAGYWSGDSAPVPVVQVCTQSTDLRGEESCAVVELPSREEACDRACLLSCNSVVERHMDAIKNNPSKQHKLAGREHLAGAIAEEGMRLCTLECTKQCSNPSSYLNSFHYQFSEHGEREVLLY